LLLGLDLQPDQPVEVAVPDGSGTRSRPGMHVRRSALPPDEVVECQGLPVTSPVRTVFDLARHLPLAEAIVAVDLALHGALVEPDELRAYVTAHPTWKGLAQARRVVTIAELRAESPMESRLRALLVLGGLPRPQAQAEIIDERGCFLGRLDLYYPTARLGIEYDGDGHRSNLAADNRRQNRLMGAGVRLLRYTAADVYRRPVDMVAEVRAALRAAS
jgi:very-short-patch-repair endonuclease